MPTEIRLPIPAGWDHVTAPTPEILVMMRPPGPLVEGEAKPVAAISRLGLRASAEPPILRLIGVKRRLTSQLCEILEQSEVEDTDIIDLGGHDVSYVRVTHEKDGHPLVSEVWSWVLGDEEWSVTGTVPLEDYPTWCDVFEAIADAFDPEEVGRHSQAG